MSTSLRFVICVVTLCGVLAAACGSPAQRPPAGATAERSPRAPAEQIGDSQFQTAVVEVPRRDFRHYWLGASFKAGGEELRGPSYALGTENSASFIELSYSANYPLASIQLTEFPPAMLPTVEPQLPSTNPGRSQMNTTVGGHPSVLYRIPLRGRPNLLTVKVDLGDAIVVADTFVDASHPDATPNPNPLVDEATLLEVLSHLRPYPQ